MDLFDQHRLAITEAEAPLAARMRPRTLDDFVGQDAIIGPGRLLRRAIQADQLSSLIFMALQERGKRRWRESLQTRPKPTSSPLMRYWQV